MINRQDRSIDHHAGPGLYFGKFSSRVISTESLDDNVAVFTAVFTEPRLKQRGSLMVD